MFSESRLRDDALMKQVHSHLVFVAIYSPCSKLFCASFAWERACASC